MLSTPANLKLLQPDRQAVTQTAMLNEARANQDMWPYGHPGCVDPESLNWIDEPAFDLNKIPSFATGGYDHLFEHIKERAIESWRSEADSFINDMNAAIRNGTIDPILLVEGKDHSFYNWDGAHRIGMAHLLGVSTMPAWVGYEC